MDFVDDYSHEIHRVMYFPRCLPTKEVEHLYKYNLEGCNCETECKSNQKCSCLERSGTCYTYDKPDNLETYSIQEESVTRPTYECNDSCKCNEQICGNRLVQFGPRRGLKVQSCNNNLKGLGLFTLGNIQTGNFVCEYAGEIITEVEAFRRFKRNKEQNKINYIFCINEHFGERMKKTFIDPMYYGNIGRYINHSCEPNCTLFVVRVNDTIPILGIFANQDIEANTEITYDYGDADGSFKNLTENVRKSCYCNSKNCRKYLPFDISLSEA